jgi:hypothetical protein
LDYDGGCKDQAAAITWETFFRPVVFSKHCLELFVGAVAKTAILAVEFKVFGAAGFKFRKCGL